jgi:putative proteasome-type protease
MKLKDGLVAIADTRLTSGTETSTAPKYQIFKNEKQSLFIMTSGLRSVRDKAVTYFSEALHEKFDHLDKLYQVVNLFGEQIKQVSREDKESIINSGLSFNIHAIVGGQLLGDDEHKLFLLYPEGNWIEIGNGYPFTIIGNSGFGKPILKRTITADSSIGFALKTGFLSFDSTRVSANDVDYPIDVIIFKSGSNNIKVKRYERNEMQSISKMWGDLLTSAIDKIPDDWMNPFISEE